MRHKKAAKTIKKLISLLKTKSLFRDPNPDPDSQVKISRQDSQAKAVVTGIDPKSGSRFAGQNQSCPASNPNPDPDSQAQNQLSGFAGQNQSSKLYLKVQ